MLRLLSDSPKHTPFGIPEGERRYWPMNEKVDPEVAGGTLGSWFFQPFETAYRRLCSQNRKFWALDQLVDRLYFAEKGNDYSGLSGGQRVAHASSFGIGSIGSFAVTLRNTLCDQKSDNNLDWFEHYLRSGVMITTPASANDAHNPVITLRELGWGVAPSDYPKPIALQIATPHGKATAYVIDLLDLPKQEYVGSGEYAIRKDGPSGPAFNAPIRETAPRLGGQTPGCPVLRRMALPPGVEFLRGVLPSKTMLRCFEWVGGIVSHQAFDPVFSRDAPEAVQDQVPIVDRLANKLGDSAARFGI